VSIFDDLGVPEKLAMSSLECHKSREKSSLGLWDMTSRTEAAGVFFLDEESFSDWASGLAGGAFDDAKVAHCS
jgi:hypothetical protein